MAPAAGPPPSRPPPPPERRARAAARLRVVRLLWPLGTLAVLAAASLPLRRVAVFVALSPPDAAARAAERFPAAEVPRARGEGAGPGAATPTAAGAGAADSGGSAPPGGERETVRLDAAAAAAPPPAGRSPDEKSIGARGDGGGGEGIPRRRRPAVPLRKECLDIVRRAGPPVDVAYEDVSGGHLGHPHRGATHEDGKTFGYVPDEAALHRGPPRFRLGGARLARACSQRDSHRKLLTEKVFVDLNATTTRQSEDGPGGPGTSPVRILCLVYTVEQHHSRLPAIRETWGHRCDGFIAASNKTDPSLSAVNIPHAGPELYKNMWQKVRSIWSYVYDHYYEKYNWFHIGGDDMYVIVDNLRLYLGSEEILTAANGGEYLPDGTEVAQVPLYLGRRYALRGDMENIFNSGGPGYTLNRAALKLLVVQGLPHHYANFHVPDEDLRVAHIFRHFGIFPYETKDETGAERYMPFMPGMHYDFRHAKISKGYQQFAIDIKEGTDCCAARSVAFHYVSPDAMRRMHALLYGHCPSSSPAGSAATDRVAEGQSVSHGQQREALT